MLEHVRPLDLRRPHRKFESSFTPQGHLKLSQFDVTVFPGVESVYQVYNALIHYTQEQEISISEALGVISIRESEHCEKEPVLQCRLLTTLANGLEVESNGAIFFGFFDFLDSPYGIFVSESIAQDDLYPYQPDIRSRLRSTSIVLITETPGTPSRPGTLDVTVTRATFSCLHNPRGMVSSPSVNETTQEFLTRYGCVMLEVLRERLGHQARP